MDSFSPHVLFIIGCFVFSIFGIGFLLGLLFDSFIHVFVLLFDFIFYLFKKPPVFLLNSKDTKIYFADHSLWSIIHEKDLRRWRCVLKIIKKRKKVSV